MKRILRIVLGLVLTLFVLAILVIGAGAYLLYTPDPEPPSLSGAIAKGGIEAGGLTRSYQAYLPKDLPKGAPLVLVLHGSGESSRDIRIETGYAFERLADKQGFAVAYPDAVEGEWNTCNAAGDGVASRRDID